MEEPHDESGHLEKLERVQRHQRKPPRAIVSGDGKGTLRLKLRGFAMLRSSGFSLEVGRGYRMFRGSRKAPSGPPFFLSPTLTASGLPLNLEALGFCSIYSSPYLLPAAPGLPVAAQLQASGSQPLHLQGSS